MANKRKQITEEQRRDALQSVKDHPNLTMKECADHLGIGLSTLSRFKTQAKRSEDREPEFIGSGHYTNPVEKENTRLQKALKDALEALKILKKAISILGS